jgi:diazepam-binding inhibitor (GABA receptor modulator, acyl-CoA-binding protein)
MLKKSMYQYSHPFNIQREFEKAAEEVRELKSLPSNEELLILYSWYKQATIGDVNIKEPLFFKFRDKAKWKAWKSLEGTGKITAQKAYVEYVKQLKKKYGLKQKSQPDSRKAG